MGVHKIPYKHITVEDSYNENSEDNKKISQNDMQKNKYESKEASMSGGNFHEKILNHLTILQDLDYFAMAFLIKILERFVNLLWLIHFLNPS